MTHIPSLALATEIASQVAGLTLGTNTFQGLSRAPGVGVPVNAVFAWGSGGAPPLRTMGDTDEIRRAVVSVSVRDAKFAAGQTLAHGILNALRGDDVATYLELKTVGSEPVAMGQDRDGNHIFMLTYVMTYQEP